MHPTPRSPVRPLLAVLICAAAFASAGCHRNNIDSGYGVAWVTLTSEPGGTTNDAAKPVDFVAYRVTVDSVTLTRSDGAVVTAVSAPEVVDFTKLKNIAELWSSSGSVADGTYVSASIELDYTSAVIAVLINGVPTAATIVDTAGAAVTTVKETVNFDPNHQFVVTPTYASTSAQRLAIDFDLSASGWVDVGPGTPVVRVAPFFTASVLPADSKLTRIRGPLINSSAGLGTYTVYVRPFNDEENSLGSLTLFGTPSTIYSINGKSYTGNSGVTALSVLSAGTTMTAAYTTFTPDVNTANGAAAGTFFPVYMVGGSTLEDQYTSGLSGDVVARTGDTLTLSNSTLILNTSLTTAYETNYTRLLVGPDTLVTVDDATTAGLTAADIAVGQHIEARGIYSVLDSGQVQLDATTNTATNTGSVRIQPSDLYGTLLSNASGNLTLNLLYINDLPAAVFDFTGNGSSAAAKPVPGAFSVDTGSLTVPADATVNGPLWVSGYLPPFGAAPPDFNASTINSESSVQVAGRGQTDAGTDGCGAGSQVCEPAQLRVLYDYSSGTTAPFTAFTFSAFSINLANASLDTAVLRIGKELIDLKSLPASPQIVPTPAAITTTFSPLYSVGNPTTSSTTPSVTTTSTAIDVFSTFPAFVAAVDQQVSATNPVRQITARGVYNRTTNTFTATTVNVVL